MNTVIKVENLSKQYRLGQVGTGSLVHDLNRTWHRIRGKEDPYLMIGEENDRTIKSSNEYIWALKDINFNVKHGEVLGIIGRNGAGKSTLLKILSRTTSPTTGSVKIKGRVASLLEVGTGFHPELSGRENIFLNGAILGMTKHDIKNKFDEIVDFSGVARYIDTPVKRYSSGMYVRLAFGVAAHLEPEILIVDEVLAVGDAEFQNRALGKMQEISQGQGRTVLFVSHNLTSIHKLCTTGMLLHQGRIALAGNIEQVLDEYSMLGNKASGSIKLDRSHEVTANKKLLITSLALSDEEFVIQNEFNKKQAIFIDIEYEVLKPGFGYNMGIELWNYRYDCIFTTKFFDTDPNGLPSKRWEKGHYHNRIKIPTEFLKDGNYFIRAAAAIPLEEMLDVFPADVGFKLNDFESVLFKTGEGRNGVMVPVLKWESYD